MGNSRMLFRAVDKQKAMTWIYIRVSNVIDSFIVTVVSIRGAILALFLNIDSVELFQENVPFYF